MAFARVVDLAGLPVVIEADSAARWEILSGFLLALPPSREQPRIAVSYQAEIATLPSGPPDRVREEFELWRNGKRLVARHPSGLMASADNREISIGGLAEPSALAFRHLFQVATTHALAYHDRFVIHAGGIASREGGFLVLGGSGSGKSTLTVAAVLARWPVLCDDLLVLRVDGRQVFVAGIPRPWTVPSDMARRAGLSSRRDVADLRGRHFLEGAAFSGGWYPAAGVLVVGHGQRAPVPEPLPTAEALGTILASFFCLDDAALAQKFFPVAASLARLPAYRFRHAFDAEHRLAVAVENLAMIGDAPAGPDE